MIELAIFGLVVGFISLCWFEWRLWTAYVANREESLLWTVQSAVSRQVPLPEALLAVAPTFRGKYAAKVLALANLLERGISLPDALAATPGLVSAGSAFLLAAGRSDQALREMVPQVVELQTARRQIADALVGRLAYLGFLILMLANVAGFLAYYIAPKFKVIYGDFGIRMPWITEQAFNAEDSILFQVAMVVLLFCALGIGAMLLRWLAGVVGLASFDHAAPGRWLIRSRASEALRGLGALLAAGGPANEALGELAKHVGPSLLRNRLLRAKTAVEAGKPLSATLTWANLISNRDASALATAEKVGNVPWVMRQLAQTKDRRATFRANLIMESLFPWSVVAIAGFVGFYAVAYMAPMIKIIAELSQ